MESEEEYGRLLGFEVVLRREGRAKILTPRLPDRKNFPPTSLPVFYNPASKTSRDMAVLFLRAFFGGEKITVCEPLAGTGVRSIRIILETGIVGYALANDISRRAYELIKINSRLNVVEDVLEASNLDGNTLLADSERPRFRYVDVDPAGSPSCFLENALRRCGKNSAIGVTATDLSALTGAKQASCLRKYDSYPVKTPFMKEVAARILAGFIVRTASRLGLSAEPVCSFVRDFYVRVFSRVDPGIEKAKRLLKLIGWIHYCPRCPAIYTQRIGEEHICRCEACSGPVHSSGPLWLGRLSDEELVKNMLHVARGEAEVYGDVVRMLEWMSEEDTSLIGYYPVNTLASLFKVSPAKPSEIVEKLREMGYRSTLTHLDRSAFKTDAPPHVVREVYTSISKQP